MNESKKPCAPVEEESRDYDALGLFRREGDNETLMAALDATWAREKADRLVLLVDEEGRMKCKPANQKATQLAPADFTANGKLPIVGAAALSTSKWGRLISWAITDETIGAVIQFFFDRAKAALSKG